MGRLAVIGLDAMEWTLVEPMIDEGELPNLARLREQSLEVQLTNQPAYRAELPWTRFITGRGSHDNGYWSTVKFEPDTYRTYAVYGHDARPFYALPDTKVLLFDFPHTVLRDDVDGIQVMAWGGHSAHYPRSGRPYGLLREIDERFGPHPGFDNDYNGQWFQPGFINDLADALIAGARRRVDVSLWLQERQPDWDLFMTAMSESHSGGHHFWHGVDPSHVHHNGPTAELARRRLRDVYKVIDESVGRLAAGLPDDTTLAVFAVHGMQPNDTDLTSMVLLPELLHRLHFGRPFLHDRRPARWVRRGHPPIVPDPRWSWAQHMRDRIIRDSSTLGRWRQRVRVAMPVNLRFAKRSLLGRRRATDPTVPWQFAPAPVETDKSVDEIQAERLSLDWQGPSWYKQHWPEMPAFVLPTFSDAHVRINLAGRERNGVVALEDYDKACDELEATVRACINPRTGNSVVGDVERVHAYDPMDPEGPDADLVIYWSEPIDAFDHPEVGLIGPFPLMRTGEHSVNGFAFLSGPGIERRHLGTRDVADLTPTLVSLLGHEHPLGMEGSSLVAGVATR